MSRSKEDVLREAAVWKANAERNQRIMAENIIDRPVTFREELNAWGMTLKEVWTEFRELGEQTPEERAAYRKEWAKAVTVNTVCLTAVFLLIVALV